MNKRLAWTLLGVALCFNLGAFALTVYGLGLPGVVETNPITAFLFEFGGPAAMFAIIFAAWLVLAKLIHSLPHPALSGIMVAACGFDFFWDVHFLAGL